ncbi:MAG: DUF3048 domain-containing protein [Bacillota bacterium]
MPRFSRRFAWYLIAIFVVSVALGGAAAYRLRLARHPVPPPPPPEPPKYYSPLTGELTSEDLTKRRPVAVMIDNHPNARPQSGLDQANVVYEVLAEGGITRYMAVYLDKAVPVVGPVRSARDYFLDLAMELDALYVHCGQSPQAEVDIPKLGINDINLEFNVPLSFSWRASDRQAPHDLYTSYDRIIGAAAEKKYRTVINGEPRQLFKRDSALAPTGAPAAEVTIPYPKGYEGYVVSWKYDPATGFYSRWSVKGQPYLDKPSGKQLVTPNIIVQYVRSEAIPKDPKLRINVYLVGEGRAQLIVKGVAIEAKWKKTSREAPTVFTDSQGNPLVLVPGQTWIEVVPLETKVNTK